MPISVPIYKSTNQTISSKINNEVVLEIYILAIRIEWTGVMNDLNRMKRVDFSHNALFLFYLDFLIQHKRYIHKVQVATERLNESTQLTIQRTCSCVYVYCLLFQCHFFLFHFIYQSPFVNSKNSNVKYIFIITTTANNNEMNPKCIDPYWFRYDKAVCRWRICWCDASTAIRWTNLPEPAALYGWLRFLPRVKRFSC